MDYGCADGRRHCRADRIDYGCADGRRHCCADRIDYGCADGRRHCCADRMDYGCADGRRHCCADGSSDRPANSPASRTGRHADTHCWLADTDFAAPLALRSRRHTRLELRR
jgi:hypothetical protein